MEHSARWETLREARPLCDGVVKEGSVGGTLLDVPMSPLRGTDKGCREASDQSWTYVCLARSDTGRGEDVPNWQPGRRGTKDCACAGGGGRRGSESHRISPLLRYSGTIDVARGLHAHGGQGHPNEHRSEGHSLQEVTALTGLRPHAHGPTTTRQQRKGELRRIRALRCGTEPTSTVRLPRRDVRRLSYTASCVRGAGELTVYLLPGLEARSSTHLSTRVPD